MYWFCFLFLHHPEFAEADSFYCLQALFSFEIRDFFLKSLDDSGSGIKQKMAQLSQLLKQKDPEVYERLEQQNLYPQYYSFRWLTLILSQEFPLPDVVRIWDSVFADENRFNFLVRICCAMIVWVKWRIVNCTLEFLLKRMHNASNPNFHRLLRTQILQSDFATNVKLLQHFPEIDINVVLSKAATL